MSVRRATMQDGGKIVDLVQEFNDSHIDIPLELTKTCDIVCDLIEFHSVFVSEAGFIGGMVSEDMFRDWTYLAELGWYATDNSGARLLKAFMQEAIDLNVDELRMCTMWNSNPIADKLLEKSGFVAVETSHRLLI
jgi:N-acetylglutamate synthase-like GNAT family acetyltransferase